MNDCVGSETLMDRTTSAVTRQQEAAVAELLAASQLLSTLPQFQLVDLSTAHTSGSTAASAADTLPVGESDDNRIVRLKIVNFSWK